MSHAQKNAFVGILARIWPTFTIRAHSPLFSGRILSCTVDHFPVGPFSHGCSIARNCSTSLLLHSAQLS